MLSIQITNGDAISQEIDINDMEDLRYAVSRLIQNFAKVLAEDDERIVEEKVNKRIDEVIARKLEDTEYQTIEELLDYVDTLERSIENIQFTIRDTGLRF